MTTKHTPGPWCYFDDVDSPFWGEIRSTVTFDLIAQQPEADDREADFVLMTASPDMLEALEDAKQLLDALRMDSGVGEILTDSQRELYAAIDAKITAAIAKAKGYLHQ